jgi:hypothetical protein
MADIVEWVLGVAPLMEEREKARRKKASAPTNAEADGKRMELECPTFVADVPHKEPDLRAPYHGQANVLLIIESNTITIIQAGTIFGDGADDWSF